MSGSQKPDLIYYTTTSRIQLMPASSNLPSPEPMEPMFDPLQCSLQLHAHNTISINDGKQGSISTLDRTIYRQLQKTREIRQQNISTVATQPMHPTKPD
jgi:hypothetical protein